MMGATSKGVERTDEATDRLEITRDDLESVASVVALRLQLRLPEAERTRRIRHFVSASSDLSIALSDHAQRAGAVCENTRVADAVTNENARLYESLRRFADVVRSIAMEFRAFTQDDMAVSDVGPE